MSPADMDLLTPSQIMEVLLRPEREAAARAKQRQRVRRGP